MSGMLQLHNVAIHKWSIMHKLSGQQVKSVLKQSGGQVYCNRPCQKSVWLGLLPDDQLAITKIYRPLQVLRELKGH